jgi:hypothetical protein
MTFGDSQWGSSYRFHNGGTTIVVMTHLRVSSDSGVRIAIIDGIVLGSVVGDEVHGQRMVDALKARFVGMRLSELEAFVLPAVELPLP